MFNEKILEFAKKYENEMVDIKNNLHEIAEISSKEFKTSQYLKDIITSYGLKYEEVKNSTGLTVTIDSGREGKFLGIRSDIDALPIKENEENLKRKRNTISKNDGVMHACGHDAHMSTSLEIMKFLNENKDLWEGKVIFIFEEGEEIGSGIEKMLYHLKGKEIDAVYANHMTSFMKAGEICVDSGPRMAGAIAVNFDIIGKSGHGSRPDLSINPVMCAANVLTGLTNAWVNQIDVSETVTFGITMIHGGSAPNIFPNSVNIQGSLRYFNDKEREHALKVLENVTINTAKAHLCEVKFNPGQGDGPLPLINNKNLAKIAQDGLDEILPGSRIEGVKWFASETFSRYSEIAPIMHSFIGIANEEYGSGAENHNEKFDIDDKSLYYAFIMTSKFALDYLNK